MLLMRVLAGGCFNKIHKGHIYFLKKAKSFGYLVVVLTHDKNNKKPYAVKAIKRRRNLAKIKIADKIIIGDAKDFSKVVKRIKPDVIILGYDQKLPIKKKGLGKIKIRRIRKLGKYSTHKIIR